MTKASFAGWTAFLAAAVSAAVLALMLYRGTAGFEAGEGISLDLPGWAILIAAVACLSVSVVLVVYSRFLHSSAGTPAEGVGQTPSDGRGPAGGGEPSPPPDLSKLPEDERHLYEMIADAGGEILQMNLVSSGEFSKSKVTRLLDKLDDRGLIKRERHGMTNLVRLVK